MGTFFRNGIILFVSSVCFAPITKADLTVFQVTSESPEVAKPIHPQRAPNTTKPSVDPSDGGGSDLKLPNMNFEKIQQMQKQFESMQKVLEDPYVQTGVSLITNEKVRDGFWSMFHHENRSKLLISLAAWFLAWIIFRSRLQFNAESWIKRSWIGIWTLAVFLVGAWIVIPGFWYGDVFSNTWKEVYSTVKVSPVFKKKPEVDRSLSAD